MRRILAVLTIAGLVGGFVLFIAFIFLVDTAPLSRTEFIKTFLRIRSFRYTGYPELTDREIKILYRWRCTGICHGSEPIETSRHTAREWEGIVARMRVRNGAKVNKRESALIIAYLQKNFGSNVPTILSPEANRFLKRYLWRSDFGESDLYVDVIYAPMEYFDLMGGFMNAVEYQAEDKTIFMVYFNTHQEKLPPFSLEKMATLRGPDGTEMKPIDWRVTYESGDLHHREGVLRFKRLPFRTGTMELILEDLPGQKKRVFSWELPIPEFKEGKR